jgi:uncharacterized protein YjiS (DUF1127 family)
MTMRHERFYSDPAEKPVADAEERRPSPLRRLIARLVAGRRPDLRNFSDVQLRDIGLSRNDIERF